MTEARIPLIVFGDGPRLNSGLARIARDLTARLVGEQEELGIRVAQVGIDYPSGWHWQGWDLCGFQETYAGGYGRKELYGACLDLQQETGERPIVLAITDPARLYDITREEASRVHGADPKPEMDLWGYLPIDSHNVHGAIGGPAREAVLVMTRVLAYTRYGAGVLKRTLPAEAPPVPHLPHGLEPIFNPEVPFDAADDAFKHWVVKVLRPEARIIGCVATNQPRKDLGLLFSSVAEVRQRGQAIGLWLHTDLFSKAWSIGQLAQDLGFRREEILVTLTERGEELTDLQLAARYAASSCTIAPGLGEGFGYPIVESLACGTPVVHGEYAGGVELIPRAEWLVPPAAWRLESCYALQRPVFNPAAMADSVMGVLESDTPARVQAAYCAGSVAHLHWGQLWPRWRAWIRTGVEARRGSSRETQPV